MREASTTLAADIWPLACVYPHVLPQVCGLSERLVTHRACVWLEAKMDVLVPPQAARVFKRFGTRVTRVRAFPCVLPQMILVVRTPFES